MLSQRGKAPPGRDKLTGFYVESAWFSILEQEVARAWQCQRPFSLLVAELGFGDGQRDYPLLWSLHYTLLRQAAPLLSEGLRRVDVPARCGGETLGILLPETPLDGGMVVAERIRRRIEAAAFTGDETLPTVKVTLNIGLATFPVHGNGGREVHASAHKAMLIARSQGGNQVVVFPDRLHEDFQPPEAEAEA